MESHEPIRAIARKIIPLISINLVIKSIFSLQLKFDFIQIRKGVGERRYGYRE